MKVAMLGGGIGIVVGILAIFAAVSLRTESALQAQDPSVSVEPCRRSESQAPDVFHVGQWVRHKDGSLGLVEEIGQDGTYRIRIETDEQGKKASWYLATFWTLALPKAREWWCNTKTGVLFQPVEDWTTYEGQGFPYEPVNWGRG